MPRKYLVTGGSGFIGSALVKRLLREGHNVRVLDNNSRGDARRLEEVLSGIEFIEGDVRDLSTVITASKGIDCICHLAYVNGTEYFYTKPELVLDVAIRGMLNIVDACRQEGVLDLVLASSSEVYQSPLMIPTPEDVPLIVPDVANPRYSYGGGKILCELMANNYGRIGFERVTIFRPHNVYGPDMGWEHVIPQFALRAKELSETTDDNLVFHIKGDGLQTRSFVYIDDFISGLMYVIDKGRHLDCYHIGTSEEVTVGALAKKILDYFGLDAYISTGAAPDGETKRRCPDITKIQRLGYSPSISLEDGLVNTIQWYVENAHINPHIT